MYTLTFCLLNLLVAFIFRWHNYIILARSIDDHASKPNCLNFSISKDHAGIHVSNLQFCKVEICVSTVRGVSEAVDIEVKVAD